MLEIKFFNLLSLHQVRSIPTTTKTKPEGWHDSNIGRCGTSFSFAGAQKEREKKEEEGEKQNNLRSSRRRHHHRWHLFTLTMMMMHD